MKQFKTVFFFLLFFAGIATSNAQDSINWISIDQLEDAIAKEPRPVFIDVYTSWCGWCKRMDKTTFIDAKIVAYINANYYAVKLDGEDKNTITYRGQEFKFVANGRRGYNELAAGFLQGQLSYPSYVFMNSDYGLLQVIKGYRTQEELLPILTFLGKKIYEQQDWDTFMSTWDGE